MTAQTTGQAGPGDAFAGYVDAMGDVPLLGHLVLYSVFDGNVSPDQLARWFSELDLDSGLLPSALRPDGAYETVTSNTRLTYPLPGQEQARPAGPGERAGGKDRDDRTVTLMVRPVLRDDRRIVCHLVREVRDAGTTRLSYTDEVAEVTFIRDRARNAAPGAGQLELIPNLSAVPQDEHDQVLEVLDTIRDQFHRRCFYLTGDKMRAMLRTYIESLHAIKIRPTGGVYFVHRHHQPTLDALRILVERFGAGSHLYRVPLPHQDEMQQMVIEAFRTKATQDLERLAKELAAAQQAAIERGGTVSAATAESLYRKFQAMQAEANEHSTLLSADLDDTSAAMDLVSVQIRALLAQAG